MYHEAIIGGRTRVQLTCEGRNCAKMVQAFGDDHNDAQRQLLALGWGLHRGRQLCPAHCREVSRRSNRQAAKVMSV
jgi:hypothetical protein